MIGGLVPDIPRCKMWSMSSEQWLKWRMLPGGPQPKTASRVGISGLSRLSARELALHMLMLGPPTPYRQIPPLLACPLQWARPWKLAELEANMDGLGETV